jgi:hypothetical protein
MSGCSQATIAAAKQNVTPCPTNRPSTILILPQSSLWLTLAGKDYHKIDEYLQQTYNKTQNMHHNENSKKYIFKKNHDKK